MFKQLSASFLVFVTLTSANVFAGWKDDIGYSRLLDEYGSSLSSGSSVKVGMVEAGSNYSPDPNSASFANVTINLRSGSSGNSGHAGSVANRLAGTNSIMPELAELDVFQSSDWINTYPNFISWGPFDCGVDVLNHSWIAYSVTSAVVTTQRSDYMVDEYEILMVAGLDNSSSFPLLLGNMYNGIVVGSSGGGHSKGGTNTDGSGRLKPDIVGTNTATSYASPVVAATAGLILNEARQNAAWSNVDKTEMLKAIVLAGGTKSEFGSWSQSSSKPLDAVYGVGEVNVFNSYGILIAGKQSGGNSNAHNSVGWDFAQSSSKSTNYFIEHTDDQGEFSAILTWHRKIVPSGGSWFSTDTSLANLDLKLWEANSNGKKGSLVFASTSSKDNVEHVYRESLAAGYYILEVAPNGSTVEYGLAWRDGFAEANSGGGDPDPVENVNISLSGIANGDSATYGEVETFSASLSGVISSVEKLELFEAGNLIHTENQSPYDFNWMPSVLGSRSLEVRATTAMGVYSENLNVTVSDGALSPSITNPSNGLSINVGESVDVVATVDGTYSEVASLTLKANGSVIGTDSTSPYTFSWSPNRAGSYTLTTEATNGSGETYVSSAVSVTASNPVENVSINLSGIANGDSGTYGEAETFSASLSGVISSVEKLELFEAGELIQTDNQLPYDFNWTPNVLGSRSLEVRATTAMGVYSENLSVSVIDGALLPNIGSPSNGLELLVGEAINVSATIGGIYSEITSVKLKVNGSVVGTDISSPYMFSWSPSGVGSYSLAVEATNGSGETFASNSVSVSVVEPIPDPVPLALGVDSDAIETGQSVVLTALVDGSVDTLDRIEFYLGSELIGSDDVSPYSVSWTSSSAGSYRFTAKSVNTANLEDDSNAINVSVTDPILEEDVIEISFSGLTQSSYRIGESASIRVNVTGHLNPIQKVSLFENGVWLKDENHSTYDFPWTASMMGTRTLNAVVKTDGGEYNKSVLVSVIDGVLDPYVSVKGGEAAKTTGEIVQVSVLDPNSVGTTELVELFVNGVKLGTSANAPFEWSWTPQLSGEYSFTAKSTNGSGEVFDTASVVISVVDPVYADLSVSLNADQTSLETGESVSLEASLLDPDARLENLSLYVNEVLLQSFAEAPFALVWSPETEATYELVAKATDLDGREFLSGTVLVKVADPIAESDVIDISLQGFDESDLTRGVEESFEVLVTGNLEPVLGVEFFVGEELVSADEAAPHGFEWIPNSKGAHELSAIVSTSLGSYTYSWDAVAADGAISIGWLGSEPTEAIEKGQTLTLSASVDAPTADVTRVRMLVGDSIVGEKTSAPFEFEYAFDQVGDIAIKFSAVNGDGESFFSSQRTFFVEEPIVEEPVAISVSAPLDGSIVENGVPVPLSVEISDTSRVVQVVYYQEGIAMAEVSNAPFAAEAIFLVDGTIEVTAKAILEDATEVGSWPVFVTVESADGEGPAPVEFQQFYSRDIGRVGKAGSTVYDESADAFLIEASGNDIWGSEDKFHFAYLKMVGDVEMVTRLNALEAVNSLSRGGLMLRSSLEATAENAAMLVNGEGGVSFQNREILGGETRQVSSGESHVLPVYLKLVKQGAKVSGFVSKDGEAWTKLSEANVVVDGEFYIGMALTARSRNRLAGAVFDAVSVRGELSVDGGSSSGGGSEPDPDPGSEDIFKSESVKSADIGAVGKSGRFEIDDVAGTATVKVASGDIWGSEDSLHFAYVELAGDFEFTARVRAFRSSSNWSKAGIMVRSSLDAGAAQASGLLLVQSRMGFLRRKTDNAETQYNSSVGSADAPVFVKLTRSGKFVTVSYSADGNSWTQFGSEEIALGETALVGLAVASENEKRDALASFDRISVLLK